MPDKTLPPKDMMFVPMTAAIPLALRPTAIPENIHPGYVTNPDNYPHIRGIKASKSFHENAFAKLTSLNELKRKPMPTMNAPQIATELQAMGRKVKADIQQQFTLVAKTIDDEIAETQSHIEAVGMFKRNDQAAEIRQVLRELKPQERVAAIDQALSDGDEGLLSSVLEAAHPITVGISKVFQDGARKRWLARTCPDELKDLDALTKERARLQDSVVAALQTADEASRGIEEYSAQIADAEAARAAFK